MFVVVLQVVVQVGLQVVGVDPAAGRNRLRGVTDRIAVFHDILPLGDIPQGDLVSAGDILLQDHPHAVDFDLLAGLHAVGQDDADVIRRVDFHVSFHSRSFL